MNVDDRIRAALRPIRDAAVPDPVERRIATVEERIPEVEDAELQALLRREIELLRAELAARQP